ncbi:carboxymuconolactone decarboxylase family protein [Thalassobaculum sp.]|uniref:carboxymuconolactone decarboxylase family protein n=1 Tax=Thalassobaculum sp. TaxID=2022740 RepID=UPI0032EAE9D6
MSRVPEIDPDALTAEQRRVYDTIVAGPRGGVRGPLAIWLQRPELADRAQALGRYCRYESSLPPRLSELAILVTAKAWGAEFEWYAHAPLARDGGLPETVIEAIRTGVEPTFAADDEAVVYTVARGMTADKRLPQDLYDRAVSVLGLGGLVDLIGVLGYYSLVSMTLNAFEVELPDGTPPPFG